MNKNEKSIYNHNTTLAVNVKCLTSNKNVSQNVRHLKMLETLINTGFFNNNIYNVLHFYITYIILYIF